MKKRIVYFAYGSNMNNGQMAGRCPNATNLGPAVLKGWGLRERLHADIEKSADEEVYGVLWGVTDECIRALDYYEGVPSYYVKKHVMVKMRGCAATVMALVYVMNPKAAKMRDDECFTFSYASGCAKGAKENDVPVHPLYEISAVVNW